MQGVAAIAEALRPVNDPAAAAAAMAARSGTFESAAAAWAGQEARAGWQSGTRGALRCLCLAGVNVGPAGAKVCVRERDRATERASEIERERGGRERERERERFSGLWAGGPPSRLASSPRTVLAQCTVPLRPAPCTLAAPPPAVVRAEGRMRERAGGVNGPAVGVNEWVVACDNSNLHVR